MGVNFFRDSFYLGCGFSPETFCRKSICVDGNIRFISSLFFLYKLDLVFLYISRSKIYKGHAFFGKKAFAKNMESLLVNWIFCVDIF